MSKKKIWSVPAALIVVLTVVFLFGGIKVSADTDTSGSCSDTVTWSYEDGTLTISGTGSIPAYSAYSAPWNNYRTYISHLVIGEGITFFGSRAFKELENLKTVSLPASLQTISFMAFYDLNDLTTVTIADNSVMQSIANNAFSDCDNLTTINLPDSITNIGNEAFCECKNLQLTALPASIESIGQSAFESCSKVAPASFPSSITNIYDSAFTGTGITTLSLSSGVEYIGTAAFSYCESLSSVDLTLSNGVVLGDNIFGGCTSLETVTISGSLTKINAYMFNGCSSLTSVALPDTVTSIGDNAFDGCANLAFTIPSGVTSIGNYAFANTALTTVNYSKDITYGSNVFDSCAELSTVTIDNGVTAISGGTFTKCSKLKTVTIPGSVTSIGIDAFSESGLTSVEIPSSVTELCENAFYNCNGLAQVTLNEGLLTIGKSAFDNCKALKSISIPASVTTFGSRSFACTGLTSITLTLNTTSGTVNSLFSGCSDLKTVVINGDITTVADGLFTDCHSLTSVTLPNTITEIGSASFDGCKSLTSFTIPSTVTKLGYGAFKSSGLTSIVIPNSVTEIGESAFSDCKKLKSVTLSNSMTTIPYCAFSSCSSLETIDFPASIESIGFGAFENSGLTFLSVPGTVNQISYGAFSSCKSLTAVEIHEGVQYIEETAFGSCVVETVILPSTCASGLDMYAFNYCSNLKTVYCTEAVKNILKLVNSKANYIIITNADNVESHIAGHSITLSADIGVNFYVALPVGYDSSNTTVEFTWGEGIDHNTQQSYVHNVTGTLTPVFEYGANYKVTCGVAARAMGDKIKMVVKSGSTVLLTDEYSVIEYINVIDKSATNLKLKRLVHSMVLYGAASQYYFEYKTDNYVDQLYGHKYSDYEGNLVENFYSGLFTIAAPDAADMTIQLIENDNLGLKYYGASVICASQMKMRFYFKVTDETAFQAVSGTASFKSTGLKFKSAKVSGEDLVYIETQGLAPGDLESIFVISIGGNSYRYDFKDYLRKVIENDQYSKFMTTAMSAYTFSHFAKQYKEG